MQKTLFYSDYFSKFRIEMPQKPSFSTQTLENYQLATIKNRLRTSLFSPPISNLENLFCEH